MPTPRAEGRPGRPVDGASATRGRSVAEAIARRARTLTAAERRRLGRWTSASMRDPRQSGALEGARDRARGLLAAEPERRRHWERVSAPLYEALVASAAEDRRYRIVMLAGHLAALLAIANVPAGLPLAVALPVVLAAPLSTWLAWGRATAWLGAIHAALAASLAGRIREDDADVLQRPWRNAIEAAPPVAPPRAGVISAFAPSTLLVVAYAIVAIGTVR